MIVRMENNIFSKYLEFYFNWISRCYMFKFIEFIIVVGGWRSIYFDWTRFGL